MSSESAIDVKPETAAPAVDVPMTDGKDAETPAGDEPPKKLSKKALKKLAKNKVRCKVS